MKHVLASLVILAAFSGFLFAQSGSGCVSLSSGTPYHFECNGHAAASCNGPGNPPPGQCCVVCWTADDCPFAAIGSCDDGGGSGGGGGQCHGSRCTEGAVQFDTPTPKPDGKIHVLFYGGKPYWLDKPADPTDALAYRDAIVQAAIQSQDAGFLLTATAPIYTDSGCIKILRGPSGGGWPVCGTCPGGLGCARVKAVGQ